MSFPKGQITILQSVRAFKASSMDVPLLDSQAVFRARRIMFLKRHSCTRNCPAPARAPKVLYLICFLFLFTFPFSSIPTMQCVRSTPCIQPYDIQA